MKRLTLILGLWGFAVSSAFAVPGTADSAYRIGGLSDFFSYVDSVNSGKRFNTHVKLDTDLNLGGIVFDGFKSFSGVFDGLGHKISNYEIVFSKKDHWRSEKGFFGRLGTGAVIRNLTLDSMCIRYEGSQRYNIPGTGFAGVIRNASVENCHVAGRVHGSGFARSVSSSSFKNCSVRLTVDDSFTEYGFCQEISCSNFEDVSIFLTMADTALTVRSGFAGTSSTRIPYPGETAPADQPPVFIRCSVQGGRMREAGFMNWIKGGVLKSCLTDCEVSGKTRTGGFFGQADSLLMVDCRAAGDVFGYGMTGGLIGEAVSAGKEQPVCLVECWASGTVSSKGSETGGLIGSMRSTQRDVGFGSLTGCYFTGNVIGKDGQTGGLVGKLQGGMRECFVLGDVSNSYSSVGALNGEWSHSEIRDCFFRGTVRGCLPRVIGFSGFRSTLRSGYAAGQIIGTQPEHDGGGLGEVDSAGAVEHFYLADDLIKPAKFYPEDYEKQKIFFKTEREMRFNAAFVEQLNEGRDIWETDNPDSPVNDGYPLLKSSGKVLRARADSNRMQK